MGTSSDGLTEWMDAASEGDQGLMRDPSRGPLEKNSVDRPSSLWE